MATQSSQQQPISEAPGGEVLASKSTQDAEGVALGLAQGLNPTMSKSQLKKQRKQQSKQTQLQPTQHYKEKAPVQELKQEASESFTKEAAFDQRAQQQQVAAEAAEKAKLRQESPIMPASQISLEPPLLSPNEKQRQAQARKEVEMLEEKERQDRISRAEREDLPFKALQEANLVSSATKLVGERRRISSYEDEEAEIEAARIAASEADLIGTVIDEEEERARRIAEDYPTFTEPLEKTKAMEEIERIRRLHSKSEKARQELAARNSAMWFPNAPRVYLPETKLWHPVTKMLRRETTTQPFFEKKKSYSPSPRYGQFIATTTQTTSSHVPTGISQSKPFIPPGTTLPVSQLVASSLQSSAKTTVLETGDVVTFSQHQTAKETSKVCKETYHSQTRPRLVVHHTGLSGKWARHTETVELHEGVDY